MSDGHLYTWGKNNEGNLGQREVVGHLTDSYSTYPKKVNIQSSEKIVSFDLGRNTLLATVESGKVFFSGMTEHIPIEVDLPKGTQVN